MGANINCSYSRTDSHPVLYYLLKHKQMEMARWLLQQKAKPQCLLRWEYMVNDRLLSCAELYDLLKSVGLKMNLRSDDGLKYNLMHYCCYFGDIEHARLLAEGEDSSFLVNDATDHSDTALTIALLSPETSEETKIALAYMLYPTSNLSLCNNSSQNAVQIALLKGKIALLFHMLPLAMTVRKDKFSNTILHLAVKAGLPTVARFVLRYNSVINLDSTDCAKDTVLTLAVKAGEEELACEILEHGADPSRVPASWNMEHSERDVLLHQALKRGMQNLSCELAKQNCVLTRDTNGDLPLHIALNGHLDKVVEFMLNLSGVSMFVNEQNECDRDTPLHLALKLGYYAHSKALIEHGANVNSTNRYGLTPCHILVMLAKGDYQSTAKESMTPEQIQELMEMMLARHPDLEIVNELTSEGGHETCLHMAIRGGAATENLARMCLKYAPKLASSRDCNEATPLILAVENGNLELVKELCDTGCELNVMNADRDTPLHIAVKRGDVDIVGGVM